MNTTFIYELIDPRNNETRYIGKADNVKRRLADHLCDKQKTYKYCWLKQLKELNLKPTLNIIDEVSKEEWKFWERFYIDLYKSWDCKLTNLTNGGEGIDGYHHTKETIQKLKLLNKREVTQETRDKISKTMEGRPAHNKGVSPPKETGNKISLRLKGRTFSEESLKKRVITRRERDNYNCSEETKEKMRKSSENYRLNNSEEFHKRYAKERVQ